MHATEGENDRESWKKAIVDAGAETSAGEHVHM